MNLYHFCKKGEHCEHSLEAVLILAENEAAAFARLSRETHTPETYWDLAKTTPCTKHGVVHKYIIR